MDLPVSLFSARWHGLALALLLPVLAWLARTTPWRRLLLPAQSHLLLGFAVALAVLWSLKAGVKPGLNLHLLGAMAAVLALGPQLALIALGLALTGITLNGALEWQGWPLNFLLMAVLPVLVASALQRLMERRLPAHFFVFIFIAAFFGAGLTVMLQGLLASAAMVAAGAYSAEFLVNEYLPYFMLLGFSEAWLSGAIITLFVVYRPEWVAAFDDRRYLADK